MSREGEIPYTLTNSIWENGEVVFSYFATLIIALLAPQGAEVENGGVLGGIQKATKGGDRLKIEMTARAFLVISRDTCWGDPPESGLRVAF